ncbi:hypothetical protein GQ54DRAFT_313527 [Martensiomyces pterosporus]|nr:hypothetical protein GQ54DRAFT_313527 [Martensiomyces pterosporus]
MDAPENSHLLLAGKWADRALSTAQDDVLKDISQRIATAKDSTQRLTATAVESDQVLNQALASEKQALADEVRGTCAQLEVLGKLVDDIDQNLKQMERAMSKAESAVGLSLGGRLEQLAKFLGTVTPASSGTQVAGVPYLRQWAPREQAIPQVLRVSEYFDEQPTEPTLTPANSDNNKSLDQ